MAINRSVCKTKAKDEKISMFKQALAVSCGMAELWERDLKLLWLNFGPELRVVKSFACRRDLARNSANSDNRQSRNIWGIN